MRISASPAEHGHEWRVLGHLLGRKETARSIARAVGLTVEQVEETCQALCEAGKLAAEDGERGRLYRVRLRAAKEG